MSGDESASFGEITGPDTPPPTSADPLTTKEIKKTRGSSRVPSPTERLAASIADHIGDIREERERLRTVVEKLQGELDTLRPRYTALQEAFRASLASNVFATAMVGLGGSLISGAGYAGDAWKAIILCLGMATFAWGFLLQVASTWLATMFRPRADPGPQPRPRSPGVADRYPSPGPGPL